MYEKKEGYTSKEFNHKEGATNIKLSAHEPDTHTPKKRIPLLYMPCTKTVAGYCHKGKSKIKIFMVSLPALHVAPQEVGSPRDVSL